MHHQHHFAVPIKLCNMAMSFFTADDFFLRGGNIGSRYITHLEDRAIWMTVMIVLMPRGLLLIEYYCRLERWYTRSTRRSVASSCPYASISWSHHVNVHWLLRQKSGHLSLSYEFSTVGTQDVLLLNKVMNWIASRRSKAWCVGSSHSFSMAATS